jgi:hypothetical protein
MSVLPRVGLTFQVLARDVAYELIPFSQRRSLHAKLAAVLEACRSGSAPISGCVAVPPTTIGYHWQQSCATVEVRGHPFPPLRMRNPLAEAGM